jgi:hypothetical protein
MIASLLGDDGGERLKRWLRGEGGAEDFATMLPSSSILHIEEKGTSVVMLKHDSGWLWLFGLEHNTIRLVSTERGRWSYDFYTVVPTGDDESLHIGISLQQKSRWDWLMENFN